MIIAGMATIPERKESFIKAAKSIACQVDRMFVYANRFTDTGILCPYLGTKNVTIIHDGDDIGANGKLYFLDQDWDYYFTVDDDFIYPPTYVDTMITRIEKYKRKAAVCVHGSIFPPQLDWYFERLAVFAAKENNDNDKLVSMAGTGTLAFHRDTFPNISYDIFKGNVMCDLMFATYCRKENIPIISIKRLANWLKPIETTGPDYWSKALRDDEGRTELAKTIDWSFQPNDFFHKQPWYWKEGSRVHLITRYRFLMKEICGGIYDLKHFLSYPSSGLKHIVDNLEKVYYFIKLKNGE